jgi:outer membrane lipoprotein carrier protein
MVVLGFFVFFVVFFCFVFCVWVGRAGRREEEDVERQLRVSRPNRFRFAYTKTFEQLIVADGDKVWIYDADLNQVSSRKISSALGSTPAALLAGGTLERDFDLAPLPPKDGLEWAQATPKAKDSAFQAVAIGFRGKTLAAVEIVDSFGQRSVLSFAQFAANAPVATESFRFTPPAGADIIE